MHKFGRVDTRREIYSRQIKYSYFISFCLKPFHKIVDISQHHSDIYLFAPKQLMGKMSELISTAPLYTKTRVHRTKIGNILCTGKGCIGCDRKYQPDVKDFSEILGEVDSVDFNKQEPRFLSSSNVNHGTRARRHGNKFSTWTVCDKTTTKKDKFRRKTKRGTEQVNHITVNYPRTDSLHKNNISDSLAIYDDKPVSNNHFEGYLKRTAETKLKTQSKNKTVSFAAPLIRQRTFTLGEERRVSELSKACLQKNEPKPEHFTGNKHARSKTYPFIAAERKTNFLKMLQSSSGGIFDIETMRGKKSSKWVKEALKSGAHEDEIFPQIHSREQESNFMKSAAKKSSGKRRPRTPEAESDTQKNKQLLLNVPRRDGFPSGVRNSVLVIEHAHERANAKDDSLHKLGFRAQQGPRCRSFPKVSILEIAENLDDLVQLGAVKLIQEYEGRWYILVSSRIIRNFLIQRGVTLRGRSFELIDINGAE